MNRSFALLLISGLLWSLAAAQEFGNPAGMLPRGAFAAGFQFHWMIHQSFGEYDLQRAYSDGTGGTDVKEARFEVDEIYAATVAYGLLDRVNVFASVGTTGQGRWESDEAGVDDWESELHSRLVWCVGGKVQVLGAPGRPGLLAAVSYLQYRGRPAWDWVYLPTGETAAAIGWETQDRIDYDQVAVAATMVWPVGRFLPYAGLGYTYSRFELDGRWVYSPYPALWVDYRGASTRDTEFNLLAGADLRLAPSWTLSFQGNLVSQYSVTFGISYRFKPW